MVGVPMTPYEVAARIWFERYMADELTHEMEDDEFEFWMQTNPAPCITFNMDDVMRTVIGLAISRMVIERMSAGEVELADRETIRKERKKRL